MLTPGGYPSSITHISPNGPCNLTIEWARPHDTLGSASRDRAHPHAQTTAYLNASPLKIGNRTYTAHAAATINNDLSHGQVHTHLKPDPFTPDAPAAPRHHHTRWRHHATIVLTKLLTPENYLALHRADTRHRLRDAEAEVSNCTHWLEQATENLRRTQVLDAVLHLNEPGQRAIGLQLAPTWQGTPDELLIVIDALADATT